MSETTNIQEFFMIVEGNGSSTSAGRRMVVAREGTANEDQML